DSQSEYLDPICIHCIFLAMRPLLPFFFFFFFLLLRHPPRSTLFPYTTLFRSKHGEQLIVPDVYTDPRFAKRIDDMTKWKTRSMICVPLRAKHRTLGVIQLINCVLDNFGDRELFFLTALCDYAAIAIENAKAVERIQELTITDDCTGLYNARHLYKTLEAEVYRSARFGHELSVIFIDLDHFKTVNDTHGHLVGSKLLAEIGYFIK